jgi:hypothetical protein
MIASVISFSQAQDRLKIGEVKDGKLKITNLEALNAFLMNNLDDNGKLENEYQVNFSPDATRCMVHYSVSGNRNNINSIGVMLVIQKMDAFIIENPQGFSPESAPGGPGGGGSATITCTGNPCNACYPDITWPAGKWFPLIICRCQDPSGICNMSVSFSINIQIGL